MFLFPLNMHHMKKKKKKKEKIDNCIEKWRRNTKFTPVIITHTIINFNLPQIAPY
jgi:ribosomal protein S19